MRRAACLVERFSIVTLGPALRAAIQHNATRYGFAAQLANIRILQSDMQSVASSPAGFEDAFIQSCQAAISEDGAGAIIIGGGPLSGMAKTLAAYGCAITGRSSVCCTAGEHVQMSETVELQEAALFECIRSQSADAPGVTRGLIRRWRKFCACAGRAMGACANSGGGARRCGKSYVTLPGR